MRPPFFWLALLIVMVGGCNRSTATPQPSPTSLPFWPTYSPQTATIEPGQTLPFQSPEYGVQTFLWWKANNTGRELSQVQAMGFGWVKQSFAWRDIETNQKDRFDWWMSDMIVNGVEAAGLKLLVRLDRQPFWSQEAGSEPLENAPPANLQDFFDFCGMMAGRYQGRIGAYQIWNEPNLNREWGDRPPDPAGYTELLKGCYTAIKVADPQAIVISAGLAPTGTHDQTAMPDTLFLQAMYQAGAANYFDVLGVNAPGYQAPPEASPDEGVTSYGGGRWFVFRHVEDMRAIMVANGDVNKQIAVLEMGWTTDTVNPSYAWHAVDEETQARYLVGAYDYAKTHWQPWIGLMVTIYIADESWKPEVDEQWWWSIVLPDGTPRPAFYALSNMDK